MKTWLQIALLVLTIVKDLVAYLKNNRNCTPEETKKHLEKVSADVQLAKAESKAKIKIVV